MQRPDGDDHLLETTSGEVTRLLGEFGVPARAFAMVGNSVKSDILPVLALGGYGVHVPYHVIWGLEVVDYSSSHPRMAVVEQASQIPVALQRLTAT